MKTKKSVPGRDERWGFGGHFVAPMLIAITLVMAIVVPPLFAQSRTPVKISVLRAAFVYFTPYVAEAKGFFAAHGLDAQLVYFRSGAETTTCVVSGSCEFGALATEHVMQVRGQGLRVKAIVANMTDSPFTLIARKEVDLPGAAKGYPAVVRDLKGLKLGITGRGASTDFTLRFLLKEAGLDPDKDVTIIATGGVSTTVAALAKGDIQGFLGFEPIQSQAIYGLGIAKPVLDIRKGAGPRLLQEYAYNSMVAREEYLDANPETARRMVAAVLDTHRFLADPKNFEETVKISEKYFEGIDAKILRQILQDSLKGYRPVITRQAVANIGEMLKFAELIKQPPAFEEVVDTRFAPTRFP
jgi:NitT/TauT family transport system substrate-binding protein